MLLWNLAVKPNKKHIKYDLDDFGAYCTIIGNTLLIFKGIHYSYLRPLAEC